MDSARGSFGDPGIKACLSAPPGLSQTATPFIASWRRGIPHTPLVAWPHDCQALGRVWPKLPCPRSQAWVPRGSSRQATGFSGVPTSQQAFRLPRVRTDALRDPAPPYGSAPSLFGSAKPPTALEGTRRVATTCTPAPDASSTQTQLSKTNRKLFANLNPRLLCRVAKDPI